jgi:hypothetical protein
MPIRIVVYFALVLLCAVISWRRGGRYERLAVAVLFGGWVLTRIAASRTAPAFLHVAVGVLVIDLACLVCFILIALKSDRFWPLWLTALHLVGTLAHLVRIIAPEMIPASYVLLLVVWSWPMLFLLMWASWTSPSRQGASLTS